MQGWDGSGIAYHRNLLESVLFPNTRHGIVPDFEVIPTVKEILSSEDAVMKQALKIIDKGMKY